jgi:hypothetical protein
MENSTSTTATTETKSAVKININPPAVFDETATVMISTTNELGKVINDVFSQVFADYYGCILDCQFMPDRSGFNVVPKLYFHVLPENRYKDGSTVAFRPMSIAVKNASTIADSVIKLSKSVNASNGTKVEITEDGISVLEDFIIAPNNNPDYIKKFRWPEAYKTEASDRETLIRVFKLDILKFIKKIYGEHDENGAKLYYQITPTGMVGSQQYRASNNWAINILRLNSRNQNKAAELLGYGIVGTDASSYINTETLNK